MEPRPDRAPQCFRCHATIMDGDLVMREHGDWYHVRCATSVRANGHRPESSKLQRIRDTASAEGPVRAAVPGGARRAEEDACAICRMSVGPDDTAMTVVGAVHLGCLPVRKLDARYR